MTTTKNYETWKKGDSLTNLGFKKIQSIETATEGWQLDLTNKDFKPPTIKMFKELKETMFKG